MSLARWFNRRNKKRIEAAAKRQRKVLLEPIEPRILLSADLNTAGVAAALSDGLDRFGDRFQGLLGAETIDGADSLLDTRMPIILQTEHEGETTERSFSPTIGELGSVPSNVDPRLNDLDGDGMVDLGEMVQSLLFEKVENFLDDPGSYPEDSLTDFMDNNLDVSIPLGSDTQVRFQVLSVTDNTVNTAGSEAELSFDADFLLTVSDDLLIDLGPKADDLGLEILPKPEYELRVDTSLGFGFAFGVRTVCQVTINEYDFFIRQPDDAVVSVTAGEKVAPIVAGSAAPLNYNDLDDDDDWFSVDVERQGSGDFSKNVVIWDNASFPDLASLVDELNSQLDNNNSPVEFVAFGSDKLQLSPVDPQVTEVTLTHAGFLGFSSNEIVAMEPEANFDLNVGFLGTEVREGTITIDADVISRFIDPNEPSVLGFVEPFIDPLYGGVLAAVDGNLAAAEAPGELVLLDEDGAGFFLRFGRGGVATEVIVPQSATTDNTTSEHLRSDVQDALDAAGLGDLITAGITGDQLTLSLPDTDGDLLGFKNDGRGEAFVLDDDGNVTLTASDQQTDFEFDSDVSFLLSLDGTVPYLITLPATDPAIEELGFALQEEAVLDPLIAANSGPANGKFGSAGNRSLTITVTNNTGATTAAALTIYESDPDDGGPLTGWDTNASLSDLVTDINQAIGGSALSGLISASVDGTEIKITPAAAVTSVKVSGGSETEFGFSTNQANHLYLTTDADAAASLSGEATFDVIIDPVPGGSPYTVAVAVPDGTTGLANYVSAINADLSGTDIEAVADGNRITLKVKDTEADGVVSFEVKVPKVTRGNMNLTDLVEDINRVLSDMEVGVIAGQSDNAITLTLSGKSLEITRTLTYDAVLTFAELDPASTSADELFEMESDPASNITLDLPLDVKLGLSKPDTTDFDPAGVSIEASFDPFIVPIVERNDRLGLLLKQDATPAVQGSDKLNLVNFEDNDVVPDGTDLINFTRMSANNVIGLLVQLQGVLDYLPQTDMFALPDIPFARAALGQPLDFGDMFGDQILFDDNDTPDDKGDDIDKLLERDNDTFFITFGTAQELSTRFSEILAFTNPIYDPNTDELTYDLPQLSDDFAEQTVPIDLSLDLAPMEGLGSESEVMLGADGTLEMILGFDLAGRGRLDLDTPLSDLNNGSGVDIKPEPAITGAEDARAIYGVLDEDVGFTVQINDDPEVTVVINADDTDGNLTVADLVADIDAALVSALGADKIDVTGQAISDDADAQPRILFTAGSSVTSFVISAQGSAGSQLGFGADDGAVAAVFASADIISSARLIDPAVFTLSVNGGSGTTVTVPASDPRVVTSSADDLILAVNDAIVEAGFTDTNDQPTVRAMRVGSRLVLVAADSSVDTFTVSANADTPAVDDLGLAANAISSDLIVLSSAISPLVGRLTASATFDATITTSDGTVTGTITIEAENTTENHTIFDLSENLNFALAEADSNGETIDLSRFLLAENDGGRLVLTARQPFLTTDPAPSLYRLSESAAFWLIITTTDTSGETDTTSTQVTVDASNTTAINSLVISINAALQGQGLENQVVADSIPVNDENGNSVGARITLTVMDPTITEIRLSTDANDPMAGELSFNTSQLAALSVIGAGDVIPDAQLTGDAIFEIDITTDDGEGGLSTTSATVTVAKTSTILSIIGATNAPVFYQLPDADATFTLDITSANPDKSVTGVNVVVEKTRTAGNRTLADLVADVNSALDDVRLNDRIVAGTDGSLLTLRAVDSDVTSFTLTAAGEDPAVTVLGFGTSQTSDDDEMLVAEKAVTPIVGRTTADAAFDIKITKSDGTTTNATIDVTEIVTSNNTAIEDLVADLNAALNAAGVNSLVAAGHLGGRLTLSAVDDSNVTAFKVVAAADNPAVTELGLPADESATANGSIDDLVADVNNGLGTAQQADGSIVDLRGQVVAEQVGSRIMLRAVDGSVVEFEIKNANSVADNKLGLPDSNSIASLQMVATDSVVPVIGRLAGDASFNVELINRNTTTETTTVTVTSTPILSGATDATTSGTLSDDAEFAVVLELADGNFEAATVSVAEWTSHDDLADALNVALADAKDSANAIVDLSEKLEASVVDSRVVLSATDTFVTGFNVVCEEDSPAMNELGLDSFQVSSGRASDNAGLGDIVTDINRALIVAGLGETLTAQVWDDKVELRLLDSTYSDFTITATAGDPAVTDLGFATSKDATVDSGFTIDADDANDPAVTELGLFDASLSRTAAPADFVIITGNGVSYPVSLSSLLTSSAPTVDDLLTTINAQTSGSVEAELNNAGNGFKLTDLATADNPAAASDLFRVDTVNASTAAFHLGIFGADISLIGEPADGVIHGDTASVEDISTRLFLRDATLAGNISVTPVSELPDDGNEVDITGNYGFVGISLTGQTDAIDIAGTFSTDFKLFDPDDAGSIAPRLTLAKLTDGVINDISSVLEFPDIDGSGTITLDVDLDPPAAGGLFASFFPSNPKVTINLADFGEPYELAGPVSATVSVDASTLENLEKFDDIRYSDVLDALDMVDEFLGAYESAGFLGEKLFVINKSISSLLSTSDIFNRAITLARGSDTQALQGLEQAFKDAFGLGDDVPFELNLVTGDGGDGNQTDYLKFEMNLEAEFNKALAVNLDLSHDPKIGHLVPPNFKVGSVLTGKGISEITLSFGIDLNQPERVVIFDDLDLSGSLAAWGSFTKAGALSGQPLQDGKAAAWIGFTVKEGSAVLRTAFDYGPKDNFASSADFAILAEPNEDGTLSSEIFSTDGSLNTDLFDGGPKDIGQEVDVTLPLYYPGSENKDYIGVITATGNIDSADDLPVPDDLAMSVPADLTTLPFAKRGLFDNLVLLVDTVDLGLLGVQEALDSEVFNVELPMIGGRLSEGAQIIEDFRVDFIRDFRDGVASALNPSDNLIGEILFDALGPNGADLLFDRVNADPMVFEPYTDALGNLIVSDFRLLGRLSSDVSFYLILNEEEPVTVTLSKADTKSNVSMDDLVEDLNNALDDAGLAERIEAIGLGSALGLRALSSKADFSDPDALSELTIEEYEGNLGELGFVHGDTASFVGTALTLRGTEVVTTKILSTTVFDESGLDFENLVSPGTFISMARFKDTDSTTGAVAGDVIKWRVRLGQTLPLGDTTAFDFDLGFPGLGLEADGALDVSLNWTFDFGFGLSEKEGVFLDLKPASNIPSRKSEPHFQAFLWVAPVAGSSMTGQLAGLQLDIDTQNWPGEVMVPNNLNATFGFSLINRKDSSAGRLSWSDIGKLGISTPTLSAESHLRLALTLGLDSELLGDTATLFPEITTNFLFDWSISRPRTYEQSEAKFSLLLERFDEHGTQTLENVPITVDISKPTATKPAELVTLVNKALKEAGLAGDSKTDAATEVWAEVAGLTGTKLKLIAVNTLIQAMDFMADAKDPAVKILGFATEQRAEKPENSATVLIAKNEIVQPQDEDSQGSKVKSLLAEGLDKVQFNVVSLNLGQFLSDVVAPYMDNIQMITGPMQPIVNVLTTPIPVISDLAGRSIRMIDLADAFGKLDARYLSAVGRLITAINKVPPNPDDVILNFGTFTIYPSTPDIDPDFLTDPNAKLADSDVKNNQKNYDFDHQISGTSSSSETASFAKKLRDGDFGDFKLPILTDPSQVFNIILGKPADLVTLDLPPLVLQFAYKQSFPIDGLPLAAFIRGTASATIDFAFGLDTYGILQAADTDWRNPFLIADGFYVNDLNPFGQDVPELRFGLSLSAGAEISIAVASAGVEGGLFATVDFDLFDPNRDGKVRISEIANTMAFQSRSDQAYLTPLSMFDVGGKVDARLFAFIEALFGAYRKEFNIVPPVTIVDFNIPFDREPILATELGDGVLQLNMGPNADQRLNGNTEDGAEKFYVKQHGADHVKVWAPDLGVDKDNAQKYKASSLIIAQGGEFNDVIDLSEVTDIDISFEIEGDAGNDTIILTKDTASAPGAATIQGGVGNDVIEGGAGNDVIFGNEGNDTIKGYGGDDIIFGDDGNISDKIVSASIDLIDGDDIIDGGAGLDLIFGAGGSDTIQGGADADLILGDGGRVIFTEDEHKLDFDNDTRIDLVATVTESGIEIDDNSQVKALGTEFGEGGSDIISGGAGSDILYGGAANDDIFGQGNNDLIFGGTGFDTIRGGSGNDTVSGGSDSDTLFGFSDNPADGDPASGDGDDVLFGDEGGDIIRGQGGDDTIRGGVGGDILFGDEGNDDLVAGDGADIVFGGPGNDTLDGGTDADILFGDNGLVATLGDDDGDNDWFPMQSTVNADGNEIKLADLADGVRGNTFNGVNPPGHENDDKDGDLLIGLGVLPANFVHDQNGNTQDLILTADVSTDGGDVIIGGDGNDVLLGGLGNDRLGGDVDPRLDQVSPFTPAGEDVLIGDGGRIEFDDGYQKMIASIVGTSGDDVLYGDNGDDIALGGGGADYVFGGFGAVITANTIGESRGRTDPAAGDKDVLFGDNGEVLFTTEFRTQKERNRDNTADIELSIKTGTVISEIRSTDTLNETGGADIVEGGVDDDVIIGGVSGDILRGDIGNDVIIGDNGRLDFAGDNDLRTLDLIESTHLSVGGNDEIFGDEGNDIVIGGAAADEITGDAGNDVMLGDNGQIEYQAGTAVTQLGLATEQESSAELTLTAASTVNTTDDKGRLSSDAVMNVSVTLRDGSVESKTVTVLKESTFENEDMDDLEFCLVDALFQADLQEFLQVEIDDNNNVVFTATDRPVEFFEIEAQTDNPAVTELGLATSQVSASAPHMLTAENPVSDNKLTRNAVIEITVTDGDTITTETAVVLAGDTANNNDVADLAADVDLALARAGLGALIEAGVDDSDQIVLTAKNTGIDLIEVRVLPQLIDEIVTTDTVAATGGIDTITGDLGDDIAIGGAKGDELFGDDGNDVMLGDSAQLLFSNGTIERIRTFDTNNDVGGEDTIEGNADADVILGGVFGDDLYGDAANPGADDGDDIILGDNGQLDVDDIDNIPGTIDLEFIRIKTIDFNLGGADNIFGNAGNDIAMGGSMGDTIIGDNAESVSGSGVFDKLEPNPGEDILIGDQGKMDFFNGLVTQIETTDTAEADGGVDTIQGNDLADIILGGVAGDELHGEAELVNGLGVAYLVDTAGDDVILGDEGLLRYDVASIPGISIDSLLVAGDDDPQTLDIIQTKDTGVLGANDDIYGNGGSDVVLGGSDSDDIYGDFYLGSLIAALNPGEDVLLGDGGEMTFINTDVTVIRTIEPGEGGSDTIQGNDLNDIVMGGFDGDWLYGEAPFQDLGLVANDGPRGGNDWILGDNGRLDYILATDTVAGRADVTMVMLDDCASTLDRVTTTDPNDGGDDIIRGNAGSDTIFGGTGKDRIWGDTHDSLGGTAPDGDDGNDLAFGDHGKIYPTLPTVFGSEYFINNNFFAIDTNEGDDGDDDVIFGNAANDNLLGQQGDDVLIGGTDTDILIGGHNISGTFSNSDGEAAHDELDDMDQALIDAILSGVLADKDPSDINDINDVMDGGSEDDLLAGDNSIVIRQSDSTSPRYQLLDGSNVIYSMVTQNVGGLYDVDVGFSPNIQDDPQAKPGSTVGYTVTLLDHSEDIQDDAAANKTDPRVFGNDVMAGGSEDDTMFGQLGDDIMQGDGSIDLQTDPTPVEFDPSPEADPSFTVPDHIDYFEVDDELENDHVFEGQRLLFNVREQTSDADDYMEGNGGNERMYGNLGQDDLIGGSSTLFGLDDATAEFFGMDPADVARPDGADLMYGGAGNPTRLARNDFVGDGTNDTTAPGSNDPQIPLENRHARDADVIMGDNANIYRVVDGTTGNYLQFSYDQDSGYESRGSLRIVPRAVEFLDYGYTYTDLADPFSLSLNAIGIGDLIYGESGDDIIHGMTGDDVLFGNSEDDDLYGEAGQDWISGGTGEDGILGDDGLIKTSRNDLVPEPFYSIDALNPEQTLIKKNDPVDTNALNAEISTPGNIQRAIINVEGALKKTVDLLAFDAGLAGVGVNDIIYGGLNDDFIHAGAGDDAVSGAEALPVFYTAGEVDVDGQGMLVEINELLQIQQNAPINDDPDLADNPFWFEFAPYNPGDILRYEGNTASNADDPHGKTTQEFALYDEFYPRRKIMLNADGEAVELADDAIYDFLLNFNEDEGPLGYDFIGDDATMMTDGDDKIFGDLGHDWIISGTGRDHMYGGRGDDLLNMDDDHDSGPGGKVGPHDPPQDLLDNTASDEYQAYADIAYGGAGRDVLILNTGADRAIDWVGEYNSYIVPFSPFGAFHISRTLQPQLPEFLYDLSASDGIDTTVPDGARYVEQKGLDVRIDPPDPLRQGEPYGELGMVRQRDYDWFKQTGAPNDPQPGNLQGNREIMRRELFQDTVAPKGAFAETEGIWTANDGKLEAAPVMLGEDAVSIYHLDQMQPSYMEALVTVNVEKDKAGFKSNAYIIYDYQGPTDFKFAGVDVGINKIQIGHYTVDGWIVDVQTPMQLKANTDYDLTLVMYGTLATIWVDETVSLNFDFSDPLYDFGMIGLATNNAVARFDDWQVQKLPPTLTFQFTEDFAGTSTNPFEEQMGDWMITDGHYNSGTVVEGDMAITTWAIEVATWSLLELEALINTKTTGGLIFDYYDADNFKFAAIDAIADQVVIGHHTSKGWFIDASVDASFETGTSYNLGISMLGTSVSVTLNDQAVVGHVFNSLLTDGFIGLLSKDGATLFDDVVVQGDDPAYAENLTAAAMPDVFIEPDSFLTDDDLAPIVDEAIERWTDALGIDDALVASLYEVSFQIVDFSDLTLGRAFEDIILIDADAAGYGWFVDTTPYDDVEFSLDAGDGELAAVLGSDAYGDMDLLTVVMHELGHVLGLEDLDPDTHDLMSETLDAGVRQLADDHINADSVEVNEADDLASLIVMDAAINEAEAIAPAQAAAAKHGNSWLTEFLTNGVGKKYNKFDPKDDIKIVV